MWTNITKNKIKMIIAIILNTILLLLNIVVFNSLEILGISEGGVSILLSLYYNNEEKFIITLFYIYNNGYDIRLFYSS